MEKGKNKETLFKLIGEELGQLWRKQAMTVGDQLRE